MPRAPDHITRAQRNEAMRAARAAGWPVRRIAQAYGLGLQSTHRVVRDVPIVLPGRWHRARMPQEAPASVLPIVHRYRAPW